MAEQILVKADKVSKKFCRSFRRSLWYGVQDVTTELFGGKGRHTELRTNEFWAVEDISFELSRGECLGLIGPNGAGKSTLLKMINGLIKPDKGKITIRGRVGALIELGAGFNPILTARENIYINGSVLGFSKREIEQKFDAIIDFAELDEFVDTPVQSFSSGMRVRLGFSVAAQMEPDVLLIDEVLAVGDAAFRTKCIGMMASLLPQTAMIFVSHSMPLIGRLSNKAMLVNGGKRALEAYDVPLNLLEYNKINRFGTSYVMGSEKVEVKSAGITGSEVPAFDEVLELTKFEPVSFFFDLSLKQPLGQCMLNLVFFDQEEKNVAESFSIDQDFSISGVAGRHLIEVAFSQFSLNPGKYSLALGVIEVKPDGSRGEIYFTQRGLLSIVVSGDSIGYSPVQLGCEWTSI